MRKKKNSRYSDEKIAEYRLLLFVNQQRQIREKRFSCEADKKGV